MSGEPSEKKGAFNRLTRTLKSFDCSQLTATIPIEDCKTDELSRKLSFIDLYAYGMSLTVGSGIYLSIGDAAAQAGPSFVISYIIAALSGLLSALCYGEFAVRLPLSGSSYSYSQVTLGEFFAWNIGWILNLEYGICGAILARGINTSISTVLQVLNIETPQFVKGYSIGGSSIFSFAVLPIIFILLCSILLFSEAKLSLKFTIVTTVLNMFILIFVIVLGFMHFNASNWTPFFPKGIGGTFSGAVTAFFSYIGFDGIATLAGEARRPKKDLHRAILYTLATVTILYVIFTSSYISITSQVHMSEGKSIIDSFGYLGMKWASILLTIVIIFVVAIVAYSSILAQPRITYQIASDGLLFKWLARLDKRKIPVNATIACVVVLCLICGFFELEELINAVSIGTIFSFVAVGCAVIIVRIRAKDDKIITYAIHPKLENLAYFSYRHLSALVSSWLILSFLFSIFFVFPEYVSSVWSVVVIPFLLVNLFLICVLKSNNIPEDFTCPLFPYIPLVSITFNIFLITHKIRDISMAIFFIYLLIGLVIYASYGYWHSTLRKKKLSNETTTKASSEEEDAI